MQRSDFLAFLVSLSITSLLIGGLAYFIYHEWARLPKAVALMICIVLAVMVIGYPIYALGRWSDRYLARMRTERQHSDVSNRER